MIAIAMLLLFQAQPLLTINEGAGMLILGLSIGFAWGVFVAITASKNRGTK
jgi:hypothetical protein